MATLAEIRGRVRLRLEEGSAAVWTNEELDEAILAGLELYNGRFPMEATQSAAVNGTNVAMPAQARAVLRVTLADGTVVPRRAAPVARTADERLAWEPFAGVIWFTRPLPAQTVTLWYQKDHAVTDVPEGDVGLLVLAGVWKALEQRAVQQLKRHGAVHATLADLTVRRAREEFERAFDTRARRVGVTLLTHD
ncbi:MAG TPA: hypothetical protein VKZ96_08885 [Thermomicrobiales bacterium]|nr:hypothetical protein [Thermomicrobiales bacterium]